MATLSNLLILIAVLFVATPLILISYFVPLRFGYPKVAKVLSLTVGSIFAVILIFQIFRDHLFSKNNARQSLNTCGITLKDDFEIINNQSAIGSDIFHTLTLHISSNDKSAIVDQITSAENYKRQVASKRIEKSEKGEPINVQIKNYDNDTSFVTEYEWQYLSRDRDSRKIVIDKRSNQLILEEMFW